MELTGLLNVLLHLETRIATFGMQLNTEVLGISMYGSCGSSLNKRAEHVNVRHQWNA